MRRQGLAPSPSFTLFRQLPCELRLKIWQDSLPATETNAVYFFRDWKWKPHAPVPHTPQPLLETDDELGEDVVNPHVPIYLPQICVNHEAREVALKWAKKHNLTLQLHERAWDEDRDAGGQVVVRPWQPASDAVYVGSDKWDEFCQRPCTFPFDGQAAVYYGTVDCGYAALNGAPSPSSVSSATGLFERPAPRQHVAIRTLAVPAADVRGRELAGLLHCLPNLEKLQLVYGPLPQPHEREEEPLVPRRWGLASAPYDGVKPFYYTDAPHGGGRYAAREEEAPLQGTELLKHVDDVEKMLLREVKQCEVESEARDAVEGDDRLPFTLEAVVFARGH